MRITKKLSVSSIAMLVASLLILSTATYAWFTVRTTLTADGINVKTAKAADLQIADSSRAYASEDINYAVDGKILDPASYSNGWVTANSDDSTDAQAGATTTAIGEDDLDGYVFADELNIKNNGDETITGVKVSVTFEETGAEGQYARVALVDGNTWNTYAVEDSGNEITIGNMAAGTEKNYVLYVWFEGTDADCTDINRGSEVPNVSIAVSCDTSSTAA